MAYDVSILKKSNWKKRLDSIESGLGIATTSLGRKGEVLKKRKGEEFLPNETHNQIKKETAKPKKRKIVKNEDAFERASDNHNTGPLRM